MRIPFATVDPADPGWRLSASAFATHTFDLDDIDEAYATFGNAAQTKALKVVVKR